MSCVVRLVAALLMMALAPAAVAQQSSGYMDLEDLSGVGPRLVVVRVMFSRTGATCPRQTGMIRISSNGGLTDTLVLLKDDSRGYRMNPTAAPDSFTRRRRIETDSCRIDIDIGEQQQKNGEWKPLVSLRQRVRGHSGGHSESRHSPRTFAGRTRSVPPRGSGGRAFRQFTPGRDRNDNGRHGI